MCNAYDLYNLSQIHFSSLTAATPPYLLPPSISVCESASTETLYIVNTALDRRHHRCIGLSINRLRLFAWLIDWCD